VLLDEMNLAHVELYFAEFLSKLELRRGCKGDVPDLEVKIGAGIAPYELPMGRNVLWVGTMNQDETTKSLSDKVLDRGIVIHFPRPTILERRKKLNPLTNPAPLLSRTEWQNWWAKETIFDDLQIKPFKEFIETMNLHLAAAGRALGHRVWQSVEYYMANYPTVRNAIANKADSVTTEKEMKIAFEDQLVQKVMPKLRGVETRGKSKTECLDKIRGQLQDEGYSIVDDFDSACEFGHGQFIWHSAKYLNEIESIETEPKQDPQ
jgi:5-methylcytosine-specific restriction endonuclease McrBC GTP-binding regulatory subunit McrB